MKPDFIDVLNGVKKIIFEVFLPELQTQQARGQAMYSAVLLDHLAARWEIEYPLLVAERDELRALAAVAAETLPPPAAELRQRCAAALAATTVATATPGPRVLIDAIQELRKLASALSAQSALPDGARDALHAYLRHQLVRDEQIVAVGGLAW